MDNTYNTKFSRHVLVVIGLSICSAAFIWGLLYSTPASACPINEQPIGAANWQSQTAQPAAPQPTSSVKAIEENFWLNFEEINTNNIILNWDTDMASDISDVKEFKIYRKPLANESTTDDIYLGTTTEKRYTVNDLERNTEYQFYVVAVLNNGEEVKSYGNETTTYYIEVDPLVSGKNVILSIEKIDHVKGYQIMRSTTDEEYNSTGERYVTIDTIDNSYKTNENGDLEYTIENLKPYVKYKLFVKAIIDDESECGYRNCESKKFDLFTTDVITGFKVSLSGNTATLKWDKYPDDNVNEYYASYSCKNKKGKTSKSAYIEDIEETSYTFKKMPPNATCTFSVVGMYDGEDVSGYPVYADKIYSTTPKGKLSMSKIYGIKNKTYNGKKQKQTILWIEYNGKEIKKGTDYTVKYKNNKNAGTATVIIKGIGDYTGTELRKFKIRKSKNPIKVKFYNRTVRSKNRNQVIKAIVVKNKKTKVVYEKLYLAPHTPSDPKLSINRKTGKITVKKGISKGKHKIKVLVWAKENKNYKFKTAIKVITITVK